MLRRSGFKRTTAYEVHEGLFTFVRPNQINDHHIKYMKCLPGIIAELKNDEQGVKDLTMIFGAHVPQNVAADLNSRGSAQAFLAQKDSSEARLFVSTFMRLGLTAPSITSLANAFCSFAEDQRDIIVETCTKASRAALPQEVSQDALKKMMDSLAAKRTPPKSKRNRGAKRHSDSDSESEEDEVNRPPLEDYIDPADRDKHLADKCDRYEGGPAGISVDLNKAAGPFVFFRNVESSAAYRDGRSAVAFAVAKFYELNPALRNVPFTRDLKNTAEYRSNVLTVIHRVISLTNPDMYTHCLARSKEAAQAELAEETRTRTARLTQTLSSDIESGLLTIADEPGRMLARVFLLKNPSLLLDGVGSLYINTLTNHFKLSQAVYGHVKDTEVGGLISDAQKVQTSARSSILRFTSNIIGGYDGMYVVRGSMVETFLEKCGGAYAGPDPDKRVEKIEDILTADPFNLHPIVAYKIARWVHACFIAFQVTSPFANKQQALFSILSRASLATRDGVLQLLSQRGACDFFRLAVLVANDHEALVGYSRGSAEAEIAAAQVLVDELSSRFGTLGIALDVLFIGKKPVGINAFHRHLCKTVGAKAIVTEAPVAPAMSWIFPLNFYLTHKFDEVLSRKLDHGADERTKISGLLRKLAGQLESASDPPSTASGKASRPSVIELDEDSAPTTAKPVSVKAEKREARQAPAIKKEETDAPAISHRFDLSKTSADGHCYFHDRNGHSGWESECPHSTDRCPCRFDLIRKSFDLDKKKYMILDDNTNRLRKKNGLAAMTLAEMLASVKDHKGCSDAEYNNPPRGAAHGLPNKSGKRRGRK